MVSIVRDPLLYAIYPDNVFLSIYGGHGKEGPLVPISPKPNDPLFCSAHGKIYTTAGVNKTRESVACLICFELVSKETAWHPSDSSCMSSAEGICEYCLKQYIVAKIDVLELNANRTIVCPCAIVGCSAVIAEEVISKILRFDESLIDKFLSFCKNVEVSTDPCKRWCPTRDCKSVITCKTNQTRAICQNCKVPCCFKCGTSHSAWITCGMASDSGFRKWKQQTVQGCRPCPTCRIFIEKDMGCQHMTCSRCHHEFCWQCMGPWRGGCRSPKAYCGAMAMLGHDIWGQSAYTRVIRKAIAMPVVTAIGCGVGGAVLGVGVAAAVVCGGVLVTMSPVLGSVYLYKHPPSFVRKYISPDQDVVNVTAATLLVKGVRVMVPWQHDDPNYLSTLEKTNGETFLGYRGRRMGCVFVAYVNSCRVFDTDFIMYFVPVGAPATDLPPVLADGNEMTLTVAYPSNTVPEEFADADVSNMIYSNIQRSIWENPAIT